MHFIFCRKMYVAIYVPYMYHIQYPLSFFIHCNTNDEYLSSMEIGHHYFVLKMQFTSIQTVQNIKILDPTSRSCIFQFLIILEIRIDSMTTLCAAIAYTKDLIFSMIAFCATHTPDKSHEKNEHKKTNGSIYLFMEPLILFFHRYLSLSLLSFFLSDSKRERVTPLIHCIFKSYVPMHTWHN